MKKRVFGILIALVIVCAGGYQVLNNQGDMVASETKFSLSAQDTSVNRGEEFTIQINLEGSTPVYSVDAYISYDDSIVEFESSDDTAIVGTTGLLHVSETFAEPVTEKEYTIHMKALEVGTASFGVTEGYFSTGTSDESSKIEASTVSIEVTENEEESDEVRLSELEVFPGTLSPEFKASVTSYAVTVDKDTEELILSAIPKDLDSVVTVDGNEAFTTGENTVVITVTAPSGKSKEYTIVVTKES